MNEKWTGVGTRNRTRVGSWGCQRFPRGGACPTGQKTPKGDPNAGRGELPQTSAKEVKFLRAIAPRPAAKPPFGGGKQKMAKLKKKYSV